MPRWPSPPPAERAAAITDPGSAGRRGQLAVAASAVLLTAADTYVVVVALPAVASGVGIGLDRLPRAASVVSAFLLGYCAVLPLLGRLSDLIGRLPVLTGCLVLFAVGAALTAGAHGLGLLLAGRVLQGIGGGGLVPATLGLVADRWPVSARGTPLGLVGAAQELGALLGPLAGAAVLAVTSWRAIFLIALALAVLLALAVVVTGRVRPRRDPVGWLLAAVAIAAAALLLAQPQALVEDVRWGELYVPVAGSTARALTPLALIAFAAVLLLGLWRARGLGRRAAVLRALDLPGAALLTVVLAGVLIACSPADPTRAAVARAWPVLLGIAAVAAVALAVRLRTAREPLIELRALTARPAWAALVVSVLVGALLIAVLVEVPLFARLTAYPVDQTAAALVLVRFLVAVPVGAALGGVALRRVPPAWPAAAGLLLASAAVAAMARWDTTALGSGLRASDAVLVAAGLGAGLAIAPVNAALLAAIPARMHGTGSALLVVARTIGQLVGLSVLTAIGLRVFVSSLRSRDLAAACGSGRLDCPAYRQGLLRAAVDELHAVLAGAAVCGLAAAGVALLLGVRRQWAAESQSGPIPTETSSGTSSG